jgi:hypothetical protein
MRGFMKNDREQQADRGGDRHPPISRNRKIRNGGREHRYRKRPRDQCSHQQPGGIDPHLKAEEREELDPMREHLSLHIAGDPRPHSQIQIDARPAIAP